MRIDNTKSYTIRCNAQVLIFEIEEYDISQKWFRHEAVNLTTYVFTPNANTSYIKILIRKSDNSIIVPSELTSFMIEEGTPTDYQDYHKTTDLSEPLPQTVYGMTLYPREGKGVIDREIVDMGDLEYTYNSSGAFFQNTSISRKYGANILCISSCYTDVGDKSAAEMSSLTTGKMASNNNNVAIKFKNTNYTDPSAFKTAMVGQKIVYPLATPIEIQLTPHEISLLKDYAYVSTNGTSIALDYHNGEIASLSDVSQLGETVNLIGEKVEFEDVSQYFTKDNTNINSAIISAYRIGKMVFISGSFIPNTLSSLQNKLLFNITNDKILPLSAYVNVSGIYYPTMSSACTATAIILNVDKLNKRIKTVNNGSYGGITNITTNSQVIFSVSYVCQG